MVYSVSFKMLPKGFIIVFPRECLGVDCMNLSTVTDPRKHCSTPCATEQEAGDSER